MTAARAAGLFLLLTALATAVSVPARLAANADQPTLAESLVAITFNNAAYTTGGGARLFSGLALLAAAWFLWQTYRGCNPASINSGTALLGISGLITGISGLCALVLAVSVPDIGPVGTPVSGDWASLYEIREIGSGTMLISDELAEGLRPWSEARWITGKVGFTLAGLGLIALAPSMWPSGGLWRIWAGLGAVIGAVMLLIWVDAATVMHRISGVAFLAWLIVSGISLTAGRVTCSLPDDSEGGA